LILAGDEVQLCAVAEAVVEVARLIEAGHVDTQYMAQRGMRCCFSRSSSTGPGWPTPPGIPGW
jgi:hypothetical protein